MHSTPRPNVTPTAGSLDGDTAADHDKPYFAIRPRASAPYPFSTRQYARLLILRGRIQDEMGASLELVPYRPFARRPR